MNNLTEKSNKTTQKLLIILLTVLPFFLAWFAVGQLIQSQLSVSQLKKVEGVVADVKEVVTKVKKRIAYTHKDVELRVYLKDNPEYFRFRSIYNYDRFAEKIHPGDSTEIYVRPKWLVPLGFGYKNDIYQMSVNGQTVFNLSQTHKNEKGVAIICILSIPVFFFLRRWAKRKMASKENS